MEEGVHRYYVLFVDKHRLALVQRVKNIEPILDGLLSYKVINRENYEEILSLHGPQEKMRSLLRGPLRVCGPGGKEIFYKLLREHESDLLDDLADESEKYKKNKKDMEVESMGAQKRLLETLNDLSSDEFNQFKSLIELEESFPRILRGRLKVANTDETVDLMVKTFSGKCVNMNKTVLKKMNRTDLVQRLSDISSGTKEEPLPSLIQSVEMMASVIELLLETLKDLSDQDLQRFQRVLNKIQSDKDYPHISPRWLMMSDRQDMVFSLVRDHGQQSVEMTQHIFSRIRRTDLVQRLSQSSSGPKKKHSEAQRPAVIQKVATMAAVKHLLLETLNDLRNEDLEKFKQSLDLIVTMNKQINMSWEWRSSTGRAQTVEQIIQIFGQQCVEITMEVLKDIKRTDLMQRFTKPSSELKEMYSVDEHRPAQSEGAPIAAVKPILLKTLKDLSGDELDRFQCLLQFTYFQKSISYSFHGYPYQTGSALELVDQMVETCGPQSVEVTREVLMDLNRTDLVERLSETILRLKEKPLPSLIQRVETMASVIELLLETLKDLSDQDLQRFQRVLNKIQSDKGYPDISPRWLMMRDRQDMVFYLVQDHSQHRLLEMTTEAFERMNRTDLVQRLSQSSSGPKKKHSDAQRPAVIQKVATMAAVKHLLLETLNDLRNEDLEKFKQTLDLIVSKKKLRYFSWILRSSAGRAQTVEQMIQIFGQQCVEITMEVLKNINRTDLRQRLTKPCSELKEMYSVDEHRPAQSEGAPIAAEKEILLKTLKDLSGDELYRFQWYLQFTYFQKSISSFHGYPYQTGSALQLVDQMVETCGPQSVEVTREVLMDMKTSDLVERLSETILRLKEKPLPSLIQRVETMASVIELLLETLKDLSHQDLESFQMVLSQILSDNGYTQILLRWLMMRDRQDMVFSLVQDHGDHRLLEMTTEAFEKMNRTDLVQRLSQSSSGPKKKHSEAQRPAVIQKVATMAAVKHLLLETLNDLRNEDLDKFKQTLDLIVSKKKRRYVSWILSSSTGRAQTVEKIIQIFGQQCVEITMEVLKDINRTDLRQRFTNLELKEMYSVDEHRPAQSEGAPIAAEKEILLKTLKDTSYDELYRFQWYLQFTYFQKSISCTFHGYPNWTASASQLVDQMVETCGPQSVEVTREVVMDMDRTDLVERLSETILRLKDKHPSKPLKEEVTVASLEKKLLETLEDLSDGELEKFKRGLQRISSQRLETAGRVEIVDLMVEIYGQQSMEVTMEIVKKMKEDDYGLEQKLSNITLGSKGPSRTLELEGSEKMTKDSSGWTKLEPEVNSTDEDEASTYSLKSEAGNFECSVSGLRWVCQEKVSFKYKFCSSEEPMKRMEMMKYMPAGPLIDITGISGKLFEVYLPHWICIDDIPKILQRFAVLHIDDCGDVVEKVSEVTSSHVKLSEPVFSPRAVLMKMGFPVKIHCNVLIYSKAYTSCTVLHVYLTPLDPALKEAIDKKKKDFKFIDKPRTNKGLPLHKGFNLTAGTTAKICPEEITLSNSSQSQSSIFFDVHFKNPISDFDLTLSQLKKGKREPRCERVWSCEILKVEATGGPSSENGSRDTARPSAGETAQYTMVDGEHFVDKHRTELTDRVNCVGNILDRLLGKEVIQQAIYDKIRKIPTNQEKMRELFSGPLNAAGPRGKEVFYRILEKEEKYLIDELKGKK
ncbi:uncharacterized protein LOC117500509 isoform X2 [Trematomus bernacchii]|uniref:uncharacterized protein LOC117500509 isoform X2 n=1 Tax=Trematomus bernacchii TaxID=40690 RepID=UPI00146EAAA1|nr:uncharacterized protein LOC117500509 isoform X2 [Trematomus bernacchii]